MLFNSYVFIFCFLPIVLAGYALLRRAQNILWPIGWLVAGFALLLRMVEAGVSAPSAVLDDGQFRVRQADHRRRRCRARSRAPFSRSASSSTSACSAISNTPAFSSPTSNEILGAHWAVPSIILPIGISFITFQKIAFLVDAYRGLVRNFTLLNYALFVTFFPQLIAGPIIHHSEIMPQIGPAQRRDFAADLRRGHQHLHRRAVQEGRDRGQPRGLCGCRLRDGESRTSARQRIGLDHRAVLQLPALLRFFRLFGHGGGPGAHVRHSGCRSISIRPTRRPRSSISGGAGTSRCRASCATICTSRLAAIGAGPCAGTSISASSCCSAGCGMAPTGRSSSGAACTA